MGQYLPNEVACAPHICCGGLVNVRELVQMCYLSWSAGMSCRTWSQMCGNFAKFLLSEWSFI